GPPNHVLLNNGTIVEHLRDVVTGRSDQLDSALECLMVGPGADERRQKRMMNVDDALRIPTDEVVRKNLHVAGEHHELWSMLGNERVNFIFGLLLIVFGDGDHSVRNLVEVRNSLVVGMVGNDQRNIAGELPALLAVKKMDQAMVVLRDEDDHARPRRRLRQS